MDRFWPVAGEDVFLRNVVGRRSGVVLKECLNFVSKALEGDLETFLANATPYLNALGHTVIAWLWLKQGLVIRAQLADAPDDAFLLGKQQAMRYFFNWELPRIEQWIKVLDPIDTTCLDMAPEWF